MNSLQTAKARADNDIANKVKTPSGKNNKREMAKVLAYLTKAHEDAGCNNAEAGNHAANYILNRC